MCERRKPLMRWNHAYAVRAVFVCPSVCPSVTLVYYRYEKTYSQTFFHQTLAMFGRGGTRIGARRMQVWYEISSVLTDVSLYLGNSTYTASCIFWLSCKFVYFIENVLYFLYFFTDMANYRGAVLRYRLHSAETCMFLSLFFVSFSLMQSYELNYERCWH